MTLFARNFLGSKSGQGVCSTVARATDTRSTEKAIIQLTFNAHRWKLYILFICKSSKRKRTLNVGSNRVGVAASLFCSLLDKVKSWVAIIWLNQCCCPRQQLLNLQLYGQKMWDAMSCGSTLVQLWLRCCHFDNFSSNKNSKGNYLHYMSTAWYPTVSIS